jgi:hypothetical protein
MSKKTKKLAKQAGFVFWKNESWGPGKGKIDWSSDYDKEFKVYTKLVVEETVKWVNDNVGLITDEARKDLHKHLGIK